MRRAHTLAETGGTTPPLTWAFMDVTIEQSIERPRPQVARYVMDHTHDTTWIGGVSESEMLGEGTFGVGSEIRRVAHFMGKRIDYVLRVERLDLDTFLGMRSVKAPFPMTVTMPGLRPRPASRSPKTCCG